MITLTLSPQQLDLVIKSLMAQPWGSVNELIQTIVKQAQPEPPAAS